MFYFSILRQKDQYYVCVALCLWGCRHYSDKDLKEIICEETVLNYKYNNSDLAILLLLVKYLLGCKGSSTQ